MSELAWIEAALVGARPQAMAALLRQFRDLDAAEEAFQEASLRALQKWPVNGPPRDAAAWLIFVGKNATIDARRRAKKQVPLPDEAMLSSLDDEETAIATTLDDGHYRDDILRLLFVCCHPQLQATAQIALSLRVVCGLSVPRIARAFLVGDAAMEQRITRAKAAIADTEIAFEAPDAVERMERLSAVSTVLYLMFNEGYSSSGESAEAKAPLATEAIRLARLLLRLFPSGAEVMGLLALMLLQNSRAAARLDEHGAIVLLDDQDRSRWDSPQIAEGLALIEKAMRHPPPGPLLVQAAIAAIHARSATAAETDWTEIDALYRTLERMTPSPVITLNRAVAVSRMTGGGALPALAMVDALAPQLGSYFYFHGLRGALLTQLGRPLEAREALTRAIGLASTAAEAAHIRMHLDKLMM